MKKVLRIFLCLAFALIAVTGSVVNVYAEEDKLYLGGYSAGFSFATRGAYIIGLCDVISENGITSPAKSAGLCVGDVILSIDGTNVNNAVDIENTLNNGKEKTLCIERDNENMLLEVTPSKDFGGKYKLGVFIRDNINGIGTITYIKNNEFASLGHPVISDNNSLLKINGGNLYDCTITGCIKGERGRSGELKGVFCGNKNIGNISKNLLTGVYGSLSDDYDYTKLTPIEKGEAKIGEATVYSTVQGTERKEYKISIVKTDFLNKENKNLVIKINDEQLTSLTGGIVQGMSGSPIVQDGKLVGAITHVFINDPQRGFGISIDNMLNN